MKVAIELGNQSLIIHPSSSQVPGEYSIILSDRSRSSFTKNSAELSQTWAVRVKERIARDIAADFLDDGRSGILFEYFPQILEGIKV